MLNTSTMPRIQAIKYMTVQECIQRMTDTDTKSALGFILIGLRKGKWRMSIVEVILVMPQRKHFFLEGGVPLGEILSVLLNCEVLNQAYASEKEL